MTAARPRRGEWLRRGQTVATGAWAAPTTAVGWVAILLAGPQVSRTRRDAVVLVTGPGAGRLFDRLNPRLRIGAMTLGGVILARDEATAEQNWQHELVHVAQARHWGPLFLPAYGLASLVAWATGHDVYEANFFELEARQLA
ncbi:MAG: hypothetical protein QG671_753 [Actinomycetota bacterium]|jgi:hypothetical protein|nr:hypothetical protein [Actinomycetota bacterium]